MSKRNLLLIGAGGNMGQNHLRVLQKLQVKHDIYIELCDSNEDLCPKGFAFYPEYDKALSIKKWDYVVIATPTPTHAEIIKACTKNKVKNIFVEKPVVDNFDNIETDELYGKHIMVGHIERFNPIIREIKELVKNRKLDTIICTRSGLEKVSDDYNVDIDLCIHDLDVCHYLTQGKITKVAKFNKNNSSNIFLNTRNEDSELVDIFLHADNKSPFKRRMIQIIGNGLFIEGDYMNQKLRVNGKKVDIKREEPLLLELEYFLSKKYTEEELMDAIKNVSILR